MTLAPSDYPPPCGGWEPAAQRDQRGARGRVRCNRPAGHPPPHRHYHRDASVVSEWGTLTSIQVGSSEKGNTNGE
jgi:hypothetical protein